MKYILAITLLGAFVLIEPAHSQQYYKWVDSKGVTNYSTHPPSNKTKNKKLAQLARMRMVVATKNLSGNFSQIQTFQTLNISITATTLMPNNIEHPPHHSAHLKMKH